MFESICYLYLSCYSHPTWLYFSLGGEEGFGYYFIPYSHPQAVKKLFLLSKLYLNLNKTSYMIYHIHLSSTSVCI